MRYGAYVITGTELHRRRAGPFVFSEAVTPKTFLKRDAGSLATVTAILYSTYVPTVYESTLGNFSGGFRFFFLVGLHL